jgi:hypothetical protein
MNLICNTDEDFPVERIKSEFEKRGYGVILTDNKDFKEQVDNLLGARDRVVKYGVF